MTETTAEPKPIPELSVSIVINAPVERVWDELGIPLTLLTPICSGE